jgi:hypothetical protein
MTTQGQAQGWFAKNWKWLIPVGCVVPLLCCGSLTVLGLLGGESAAARVDCGTPGPEGVECEIKRTAGTNAFQACWELAITCANQTTMVGSGCGEVAVGAKTGKVRMPVESFSNREACDAPKSGQVEKLTIDEL